MLNVVDAYKKVVAANPSKCVTSILETENSFVMNNPPINCTDAFSQLVAIDKSTGKISPYPTALPFMVALGNKVIKKYSQKELLAIINGRYNA